MKPVAPGSRLAPSLSPVPTPTPGPRRRDPPLSAGCGATQASRVKSARGRGTSCLPVVALRLRLQSREEKRLALGAPRAEEEGEGRRLLQLGGSSGTAPGWQDSEIRRLPASLRGGGCKLFIKSIRATPYWGRCEMPYKCRSPSGRGFIL